MTLKQEINLVLSSLGRDQRLWPIGFAGIIFNHEPGSMCPLGMDNISRCLGELSDLTCSLASLRGTAQAATSMSEFEAFR